MSRRSGLRVPRGRAWLLLAPLACVTGPAPLIGQSPEQAPRQTRAPVAFELFAGDQLDPYVRSLQNTGLVAPYPWSIRGFSPGEIRDWAIPDTRHPWADRYSFASGEPESLEYGLIRPRIDAVYNSAFPYGGNDGPLWAGRGVTSMVRFGGYGRYGPLSLIIAPVAFRAENQAFELAPAGGGEVGQFRNPLTPNTVDLPQRFGPDAYQRLDPGYSTVRLDVGGAALGVSTAAQHWGPSQIHPLVLGPNPGGFFHAFVGTSHPVDIWIGGLHGRLVGGRLEASEFIPERDMDPRRLMTGLVVVFQPRGLSGLEMGITRFSHMEWPERGVRMSDLLKPFETIIGERTRDEVREYPDNELASAFFRWNVPDAGFEIFGEWVRIDGAVDTRTFLMEPDDLAGYALGMRRVWQGPEHRLTVLRGEVFSTVSSHRERGGARLQFAQRARPMYQHSRLVQGHTHRGQLLASPAGHGGQGSTLGVDRYDSGGRWTVEWERRLERDRTVRPPSGTSADADVTYALGFETVRFTGPVDLELGVRAVYNLSRYLQDDAFNLNLRLGVSAAFF
jgi:hypothetical protein